LVCSCGCIVLVFLDAFGKAAGGWYAFDEMARGWYAFGEMARGWYTAEGRGRSRENGSSFSRESTMAFCSFFLVLTFCTAAVSFRGFPIALYFSPFCPRDFSARGRSIDEKVRDCRMSPLYPPQLAYSRNEQLECQDSPRSIVF
jgi:hypothetical protein